MDAQGGAREGYTAGVRGGNPIIDILFGEPGAMVAVEGTWAALQTQLTHVVD
jgi:hypothetical protein